MSERTGKVVIGNIATTTLHTGSAVVIATLVTNDYIIVSLSDFTTIVANHDGRAIHTIAQHKSSVWSLTTIGTTLLCGESNGDIRAFELGTWRLVCEFIGHTATVRAIAWISDSEFISGSRDGNLKVWTVGNPDEASGKCLSTLSGHKGRIVSLAVDLKSRIVAAGGHDDQACRLWRLTGPYDLMHILEGHTDGIRTLKFFQPRAAVDEKDEGLQIITGGCRGALRCWNAVTGALIAELEPHISIITRIELVDLSLHGHCSMLTVGGDGAIKAWKFDGKWTLPWQLPEAHMFAIPCLNVYQQWAISISPSEITRIWDVKDGRMVAETQRRGHSFYYADFMGPDHIMTVAHIDSRGTGQIVLEISRVSSGSTSA